MELNTANSQKYVVVTSLPVVFSNSNSLAQAHAERADRERCSVIFRKMKLWVPEKNWE